MSELDQLLKQDPDFLPLNDWKKDNDTGDEIKNRKNYADYVRGEYVSAGAYSDRIANEIAQSTLDSAVVDGVIKADDKAAQEMLFTPLIIGALMLLTGLRLPLVLIMIS